MRFSCFLSVFTTWSGATNGTWAANDMFYPRCLIIVPPGTTMINNHSSWFKEKISFEEVQSIGQLLTDWQCHFGLTVAHSDGRAKNSAFRDVIGTNTKERLFHCYFNFTWTTCQWFSSNCYNKRNLTYEVFVFLERFHHLVRHNERHVGCQRHVLPKMFYRPATRNNHD